MSRPSALSLALDIPTRSLQDVAPELLRIDESHAVSRVLQFDSGCGLLESRRLRGLTFQRLCVGPNGAEIASYMLLAPRLR